LKLTICHLYPDLMNIYGDRGNIIALSRRAEWAGLEVELKRVDLGEAPDFRAYDILFIGGGQDKEQALIARDLAEVKAAALRQAVHDGLVVLAVCGGYQLLGRYFRTGTDAVLPGIEVFDAWTVAGRTRSIGDVIARSEVGGRPRTLVGFENHSGKTYLGERAQPLARVLSGHGNNAEDGYEGAVQHNAFGTYLHGSLLPKNPWLTDLLIRRAVERRYGPRAALPPVDDAVEMLAHQAVIERIRRRGRLDTGRR
jgi:CobQ-like glutamine amidotransferase family enzyme